MTPVRIKIFTTGGSIDKGYSTTESDFLVQDPKIEGILKEAKVTVAYDIEPLLKKDSLDITDADRELIARRVEVDPASKVLITHGTDTMVDTGRRLSSIPGKTIVLTGAMQPASFKYSDAAFNIGFAISALQNLPEGVYIAMNGKIFDPTKTKKIIEEDRFIEDRFVGDD
jgi:L-asparaginase